ncbi:hypothetical protein GCM10009715_02460 [Paeniglutamicibacter psychrophenolicus]|uniref:Uncharacterized protein n=1 Tax=Paeniglutamicibacter psychrophenolicus TaxID=257454 RepID=A0ABS4WB48_9MICC|nr:hypothetical protein [Paeniglutamicibacter psychrophenolicus]MBP2373430.1 hypothetical protein [Paeniglutamicibacter psychrophenolicus]
MTRHSKDRRLTQTQGKIPYMPLTRRYDPTIEDPRIPDANEFQHMALGFVERRIRILHFMLYGAGIFLASSAALLVRWLTDVDPWGATVMTGLGIVVLLVSWAVAGLAALRPIRPSVAFTVADQSIRGDKAAAISVAMTGAVFTVVVAFMAGDHDIARVASILVGTWVAIAVAIHGLLHARRLRMERDEVYAAHLAKNGASPQPNRRVVREVMPGPQVFDTEPTEFELEAAAYAGTRVRAWAWMLFGPLFVYFLAPLLVMSWAMGFDYEMWIVPVLVALGFALACFVHGLLKLKRDRRGKVRFRQWYGRNMYQSVGSNRKTGILYYSMAAGIFITGALLAGIAASPEFVLYPTAFAIMVAAMSPLMFIASRILHRRRELYTAWLLRNGLPVENTPSERPENPPRSAGNTGRT